MHVQYVCTCMCVCVCVCTRHVPIHSTEQLCGQSHVHTVTVAMTNAIMVTKSNQPSLKEEGGGVEGQM